MNIKLKMIIHHYYLLTLKKSLELCYDEVQFVSSNCFLLSEDLSQTYSNAAHNDDLEMDVTGHDSRMVSQEISIDDDDTVDDNTHG